MQVLHSNIIGKGTPIIILHGFLGMSDNWKSIGTKYAEEGYEAHLIDLRNHGKSFHSDIFNYEVMAADIQHYMAYHHISEAIALGHSMGGKVAMQFACIHPRMVSKLLVADIAPKFYPPHHQDIIDALNAIDIQGITSRKEAEDRLSEHLRSITIRQFLLKNLYWADKGVLDFRFNLKVLSHSMEEIGENIETLDSYTGPVLFLRGDRSEYISESDLPEIKKHFPKAELVTIEKAGHWLHAENPSQFFEKSISFIKSSPAP